MKFQEDPPAVPTPALTPLAQIEQRILRAAIQIHEIGNRLRDHADLIYGSAPEADMPVAGKREQPTAALDRVFYALDELEISQSYMARQADRNTTLA